MKKGLNPIVDRRTRVVILGSLPGDVSLAKQQYYASRSNDFWKLVGSSFGEDLVSFSYDERITILQEHQVGLWDVLHRASRPGSGDHGIETEEPNDFRRLKAEAPNLELACFNGKKAGEYAGPLRNMGYNTVTLPSSSGANRRNQQARQEAWRNALSKATAE